MPVLVIFSSEEICPETSRFHLIWRLVPLGRFLSLVFVSALLFIYERQTYFYQSSGASHVCEGFVLEGRSGLVPMSLPRGRWVPGSKTDSTEDIMYTIGNVSTTYVIKTALGSLVYLII
ncbi:hypothetical protein AVEN_234775-1 [Araneus ventricosus]|uniref:Uncharacterized protein n=1 Tax=Araneus ventricosus TaxID=182803 RepID=A0A4Y2LZ74_ARAVE|nr:hypothetical protein AVEN_234775-1 [Araneus ventricosus]